jgi:hypothetical protein
VNAGTSNSKQVKILIALLIVAGLSVGRMVWLWGRPAVPTAAASNTVAPPPGTRPRLTPRGNQRQRGVNLGPSEDPRLRLDLLKTSENTKYQGTGRNIFQQHMEEIPPPIVAANKPQPGPVIPQGPPPPPPINLKFFGFANQAGERKKVFLVQGGDVFIAGEGDIVDRRYRVVRIQPFSVEIEDVLNNNRQTIPLQQS